jgi:hypothetical protein
MSSLRCTSLATVRRDTPAASAICSKETRFMSSCLCVREATTPWLNSHADILTVTKQGTQTSRDGHTVRTTREGKPAERAGSATS